MSSKFNVSVVEEEHKRLKKPIKITTITKKNKTTILTEDIKTIAEKMMGSNPKKRLMIKCLSSNGYFQMKGYDDDLDIILEDDQYFNGREDLEDLKSDIYKVSFYLI